MRSILMMQDVPEHVVAFQNVYQARSRVLILRRLLSGPATFAQLQADLQVSIGALRDGVNFLESVGYVEDDAPNLIARKPSHTQFRAVRETVMSDMSETIRYLTI